MTLYLLPNLLSPLADHRLFLPEGIRDVMAKIDGLIAESEQGGRRYLKRFVTRKKPHEMPIALLTAKQQLLDFLLEPLFKGENWGVISDCGLPCLADPGAALVRRAHQLRIPVEAYPGPSSITYALMLSGLNGQTFAFHGYLPKDCKARSSTLRIWEATRDTTHLFIEAPYRNQYTFAACLKELHDATSLCVACNLTMPDQWIETKPLKIWRAASMPIIEKKPMIFLFHRSSG